MKRQNSSRVFRNLQKPRPRSQSTVNLGQGQQEHCGEGDVQHLTEKFRSPERTKMGILQLKRLITNVEKTPTNLGMPLAFNPSCESTPVNNTRPEFLSSHIPPKSSSSSNSSSSPNKRISPDKTGRAMGDKTNRTLTYREPRESDSSSSLTCSSQYDDNDSVYTSDDNEQEYAWELIEDLSERVQNLSIEVKSGISDKDPTNGDTKGRGNVKRSVFRLPGRDTYRVDDKLDDNEDECFFGASLLARDQVYTKSTGDLNEGNQVTAVHPCVRVEQIREPLSPYTFLTEIRRIDEQLPGGWCSAKGRRRMFRNYKICRQEEVATEPKEWITYGLKELLQIGSSPVCRQQLESWAYQVHQMPSVCLEKATSAIDTEDYWLKWTYLVERSWMASGSWYSSYKSPPDSVNEDNNQLTDTKRVRSWARFSTPYKSPPDSVNEDNEGNKQLTDTKRVKSWTRFSTPQKSPPDSVNEDNKQLTDTKRVRSLTRFSTPYECPALRSASEGMIVHKDKPHQSPVKRMYSRRDVTSNTERNLDRKCDASVRNGVVVSPQDINLEIHASTVTGTRSVQFKPALKRQPGCTRLNNKAYLDEASEINPHLPLKCPW